MVLLGLWFSSGFGRRIRTPYFEGIHYDLVQGTLWVFFRESKRVLNLTIETVGPSPDAHPGTPILVCCRHAGPGDSFTLIHALMHDYAREPRVVLKDTLAWDPAIGVVLSRIPARFISPNPAAGADLESQITALATGLDENDAFVIFPEGGNFTPARRLRGIDRLRKLGLERMAVRAEQMTNVLAPRPGGLLAALDGAPDADVVMVAHTGLDHLVTVAGPVAGAADGQAADDAVVDGAARGDPARTARPGSTGCSAGGSASTRGSPTTHPSRWCPGPGRPRSPEADLRAPRVTLGYFLELRQGPWSCPRRRHDELDHVGRVVGRGHRVRRLGGVGQGLVGTGPARVVAGLAGQRVGERVGEPVGRRRGGRRCRGGRGRHVGRLPVVGSPAGRGTA